MKLQKIVIQFESGKEIYSGLMIPENIKKVREFYQKFFPFATFRIIDVKE